MVIHSKKESDFLIRKIGLNHIDFMSFDLGDCSIDDVICAIDNGEESRNKVYNIRDNEHYNGKFTVGIHFKNLREELKNYMGCRVRINENIIDYDKDNLIVKGDIVLHRDFTVRATISGVKGITQREASNNPNVFETVDCNIVNEKFISKYKRELEKVLDLICKNNLFDVIVEFGVYDKAIGVNNENIIFWELRTR